MKIAIVGCGVVGSSWALVYSRGGHDVVVYDQSPTAAHAALSFAQEADPESASRIHVAESLALALDGVAYVQENAPERLPIKQQLYAEMQNLVSPETIIGSSTSGLPASSFTEELSCRSRCVVAHPINPPHLIPLVELIPAPWTAPETLSFVKALMEDVGQTPIVLTREINGFVVNRLQSAMLAEAFRLVEDGVCSAADVDKAVADGLGLRWSFMGPFATIDLNAANGLREYCDNLGPMYHGLAKEQADPRVWSEQLVSAIEAEIRAVVPSSKLPERRAWRDRFLANIVTAKNHIREEIGS